MGSGAGHTHASAVSVGSEYRKPLFLAFLLTAGYMVAEIIGGALTGSLALISDAAHMGTDALGVGMALAAVLLSGRKGPAHRTYGTYRLEVLTALANGVLLFGVAIWVLFKAYERWSDPPEVLGAQMALIAAGGLIVNIISFFLLQRGASKSINVKGAYLEVLGDLLGSVAVLVGALIISFTGWQYVDPILGAAIGVFILPRTLSLMRQALRILMEAAPRTISIEKLQSELRDLPGVAAVHDVHVWTITSGLEAATGHLVVEPQADTHAVLDAAQQLLRQTYNISHVTFQTEPQEHTEPSGECLMACTQ